MDPNLLDIIIILTMFVSGLLALTQGFIKEILVVNEQPVQYDDPLIILE